MLKDKSLQRTKKHELKRVKSWNGGFKLSSMVLSFIVLPSVLLCPLPAWAQAPLDSDPNYKREFLATTPQTQPNIFKPKIHYDRLFSPSAGQILYKIAYEMINNEDMTERQIEQAIVFLNATTNLDGRAHYILPDLIKLTSKFSSQLSDQDHSVLIRDLLTKYTDESTDLEAAEKAIQYLLGKLNFREHRETLLKELLKNLGNKNKVLGSELATLLGILMVEKADLDSASEYLLQAYDKNKYNKLAFAKLVEIIPEQINSVVYLEQLRLTIDENPFSVEAALAFAQYNERLQLYEIAMGMYEYCSDLFMFLHPSEPLPSYIYLPWTISCYNTQRNRYKCLQIASQVRQSGQFDLLTEVIASKAAAKIGDLQQAASILKDAEDKAKRLIIDNELTAIENNQTSKNKSINNNQLSAVSLAWFYCFALPDFDKALDWANRAYSNDPNSTTAAAILAYSLVMNGQTKLAKSIIENYPQNQIADLTLAKIQFTEDQKDSAVETLKSVIAANPGTLEAEHAKEILAQHRQEYVAPIDTDMALDLLKNNFGEAVVPTFISPDKIISFQLNLRGTKFSYDVEFSGTIVITNNSSHKIAINDDSLFKGNIRVDANITGDLNKKIPNLVAKKIKPASLIEPDQSLLIPVNLFTGALRDLLLSHPQASLDIEFTAFIDPVTTAEGKTTNALAAIEPATILIKRPSVKITGKYLQNRLDSFSQGKQNQKIRILRLFIGLLMEQHAMANREPLYKFMYADWMPDLLKSTLLHGLADDDWIVKVHCMAGIISLPLDYELISAVAENLNDSHWPVRLVAMYLLAKKQGYNFNKVLDWSARYDQNELVRSMAIALGAVVPETQELQDQSTPDNQNNQTTTNKQ